MAAYQRVCTECGVPFSTTNAGAKTCTPAHRKQRSRRIAKGDTREFAIDVSKTAAIMEKARDLALEDLQDVTREVLAEEIRPAVREALSGEVLGAIGDLMGLVPLANLALEQELRAVKQVFCEDGTPMLDDDGRPIIISDSEVRLKAAQVVLKYTLAQPGLAPQPDMPDAAPIIVNFGSMPGLSQAISGADGDAVEIGEGERMCDMCTAVKPIAEFVGSSSRCVDCHTGNRVRIEKAIEERTRGAS